MASKYLDAAEAAERLNLPNTRALHAMLCRRRKSGRPITTYRLNGRLRFLPQDLDAALTVERAPKRAETR